MNLNPTVLALASPKIRSAMIRAALESRYPLVARAKSASRLVRSDGTAERFVFLYDHPVNGKCIGRVLPRTIELFVEAELWERSPGRFYDFQPDMAYDRFYPVSE